MLFKVRLPMSRDAKLRPLFKPESCCMKRLTEWINLLNEVVRLSKEILLCLVLIGQLQGVEPTDPPGHFESKLPSTSLADSPTLSSRTCLNS